MLKIRTAAEARKYREERIEKIVEKTIQEAQENGDTDCRFHSPLPAGIIKQLIDLGYIVEEGNIVIWA